MWREAKQPLSITLPLATLQKTASPAVGEERVQRREAFRSMEAHHLRHVGEEGYLCRVLATWTLSMAFGDSSPLGPAITNGVADARTSRDLTRCMMAADDTQQLMGN